MRILFLDDERIRHDAFDRENADHEVWHAYNMAQFRKALDGNTFDVISFDHDLGTKEDGNDCARFLVEHKEPCWWPNQCVVHSWNPAGAQRIMATLMRACDEKHMDVIRRPFACREEPIAIGEPK